MVRKRGTNRRGQPTDGKLGLPVKRGANGEASCLINRVLVEHHSRLIELHNPFLQKKIRQWEAGVFTNSQGKLPSEANHLLLSTHILKHLINEGIGLRQLCDIAMAFNALHSVTNKNELECICRNGTFTGGTGYFMPY